ncbi:MAG: hypothetical protein H6R17_649 [Proteobacteria bacterium]|nr:hypothetical protein [Pseudomonadota bacterium]
MISMINTSLAASSIGNFRPRQQEKIAGAPESDADQVSLSEEARQRLATDESAAGTATDVYRVSGPVYRISDMVEISGKALVAVKMTDAQIAEIKLHDQQVAAREQANFNYAQSHQYQPVGQVFVNGQLVATVLDSGAYELSSSIPGLSDTTLSPQERLAEIARAVNGKISYSDFVATGSWSGPAAPEAMLPPLTARSLMEIIEQEIEPLRQKQRQLQA